MERLYTGKGNYSLDAFYMNGSRGREIVPSGLNIFLLHNPLPTIRGL
mgnify:FL=1